MKVIRLVRALKLKKILAEIECTQYNVILKDHFSFGNALNSFLSFLRLCLLILCIAHWCACVWNLVELWHHEMGETWMSKQNLLEKNWDS